MTTDDPLAELRRRLAIAIGNRVRELTPEATFWLADTVLDEMRAHRAEVFEALGGELEESHATCDQPEYDGGRKWFSDGRWLYPGDEIWTFESGSA